MMVQMGIMMHTFGQALLEGIHTVPLGCTHKSDRCRCLKNETRELEREVQTMAPFLTSTHLANQSVSAVNVCVEEMDAAPLMPLDDPTGTSFDAH